MSALRHDAVDVARALVALDGRATHDTRTQWLVYACDGWSLAVRDHGMVNERPGAGATGPVYASLERSRDRGHGIRPALDGGALDAVALDIVARVSRKYGDLSVGELAVANLHEGNPWYDASHAETAIAAEACRTHFRALALAGRSR